jgi:hypothetical protein
MCLGLVVHAEKLLVSQIYFSPLQVENKACDRDTQHVSILGLYSTIANSYRPKSTY